MSHSGVHKCLPHDPSILSPRGLPGRSRPCFPRAWVPSRVHCSQQFLTAHSERSTWPATRRVDQPAVFIQMIRPLLNSLNCEKCLLARLPGMLRLSKSSYNRRTLPWPARSPDLSPVEHVWDLLKRQMPSCHSVHDLELAVQDLWAHLPQENIRCLINSMPDRVAACITAGGGLTHY
ncbi:transposable element Tcb2 transposase [Trichonephila clavipes]|nr:transposable element Tcb2 transposase [Trichonephila clavipes]